MSPAVVCADGSQCPDGNTCCPLETVSGYGCCPHPQAVCCSDNLQCCPHGYTCAGGTNTCTRSDSTVPATKKLPSIPSNAKLGDIKATSPMQVCPDGQSDCTSADTCCMSSNGHYGCCPKVNAVCCADMLHCCPSGTTCNLSSGTCDNDGLVISMLEKRVESSSDTVPPNKKQPAINAPQNVVCPDQKSQCASGSTCCLLASGEYGCCPVVNALCCKDHVHCCPSGYTCNVAGGTCSKGNSIVTILKKQPAINAPHNVDCPDGKTQCASGSTCCLLASGQYGCCPVVNAVCCNDHVHCCPSGYKCEVSDGKCTKGDSVVPFLEKLPAINAPQNVVCPDQKSQCASGSTCCLLASGEYGCCPVVNALCCKDHVHCCPSGYTCNVAGGTCSKGNSIVTILKKQPAINAPQNVDCPDGKSQCASGSTCCLLASGQYGCCPEVNAVCCNDHVHCCPSGYKCEVSDGKCTKGDSVVPFLEKLPAINTPQNFNKPTMARRIQNALSVEVSSTEPLANKPCGSQTRFSCSTTQKCCLNSTNGWGCCPYVDGVCCSGTDSCCPSGNECKSGRCKQNGLSFLASKHRPAATLKEIEVNLTPLVSNKLLATEESASVNCPNNISKCSSGSTCCLLASGAYGCCPQVNAVCCKDKIHCCPSGYECNLDEKTCTKGDSIVTILKKQPAINAHQNVVCPDQKSQCASGSTCCLLASGEYGCCPVVNALCCKDHVHCCPSGYTCNVAGGTCSKGNSIVTILKKQPAINAPQNVKCPDGGECPEYDTCCLLKSGLEYGCCPEVNAVCCNDGVHCCPSGYICEVFDGTCSKGDSIVTILKKQPAINAPQNVVCPDQKSQCASGSTCCLLASGEYGCCPKVNATCCKDHVHCCPSGYTCNVAGGTCSKGNSIVTILKKQPAINAPQNVDCPDGKSQCASGSTCCLLASGEYGCCPVVNAVCCNDHVHCCPSGYKCEVSDGKCTKGDSVVPFLEKLPAINAPQNVKCPDGKSQCASGSTCCLLASGEYGCCPIASAVCCNDHIHCCPSGYTCEVSDGTCTKGDSIVTILKKQPAFNALQNVVCPDGKSECPSENTCCSSNGVESYSCCPSPDADCCSDGKHCCPSGYTCDVAAGTCVNGNVGDTHYVPFLRRQNTVNLRLSHPKNHDLL